MEMKFAERLRILRESSSLTQERLSVLFGIPCSTLSRYENGKTVPNADAICKYCRYFKVSADYVLGLSRFKNSLETYVKDSERIMLKVKAFDSLRYSIENFEKELNELKEKEKLKEEEFEGV